MKPTMTVKQIGEAMFGSDQQPMTPEQTKIMLILIQLEFSEQPLTEEMKKSFPYQIIQKRIEWFADFRKQMQFDMTDTPIATDHLMMMFACVCDRPGMAVLYAAAIAAMYMKNQRTVTMQVAFMHFFGNGFPSEEAMEEIWDAQKIGGANSVDTNEAWYWDLDVPVYHVDTAEQAFDLMKNLSDKES